MVWYGMVNVDLYSAIITKVSNALDTLVSGEKPGFQVLYIILYCGLAKSNGRLLLGIWRDSLHVTFGLTACIPGSAPGPTLGNEYGKTLPLPFIVAVLC